MRWIIAFFLAAAVCASSCGKKPEQREGHDGGEPATGSGQGIKKDVGDFVDYATGKGPIEHGKRIKRRLRKIQDERNKRIEEQMGK